jgi:hypothetical protein
VFSFQQNKHFSDYSVSYLPAIAAGRKGLGDATPLQTVIRLLICIGCIARVRMAVFQVSAWQRSLRALGDEKLRFCQFLSKAEVTFGKLSATVPYSYASPVVDLSSPCFW